MNQTAQYFDISKLACKLSQKVYDIEAEYANTIPDCIYKVCSRCKKKKHTHQYGMHSYNGKPRKCCNQCIEYSDKYRLKENMLHK